MRLKIHLEFREEAAVTRSVFRAVFCVTLPTEGLCVEKGRDRETKLWGTPTFRSKGGGGTTKERPVRKETTQKSVTLGTSEGCAPRQSDGLPGVLGTLPTADTRRGLQQQVSLRSACRVSGAVGAMVN